MVSQTTFDEVLFSVDRGVALVTLNRPARRNAWTLTLATELSQALALCDADEDVRAVVVTGAGDAFSVGADLSSGDIAAPGGAPSRVPSEVGMMPPEVRKPVVAAINGHAVGAGMTFPLLCDIRLVAEDAKVGFPFVRRGVVAEMGGHWNLLRAAGLTVAADLLLTGRLLSGREAADLRVCTRALPADDVLPEALRTARDIAVHVAPAAAAASKRLLWESLQMPSAEALRREGEVFAALAASPDAREGVESFLQKRVPEWSSSPGDAPTPSAIPSPETSP